MKTLLPFVALLLTGLAGKAQVINIPDANFKAKLLEADVTNSIALDLNLENLKIDANSDGEIDQNEALAVRWLFYVLPPPLRPGDNSATENRQAESFNIADLTGIEYFTNIERMDISNNLLTALDVSTLVNLDYLECSENQLTSLNVIGAVSLRSLICSQNQLTSLNVAGLMQLNYLYCQDNQITTLDISNLPIYRLACQNNQLTNIQFGANTALDFVYCYNNQLTTLDLSDTAVAKLYCYSNPNLTYINIKNGINSMYTYDAPPFPIPVESFGIYDVPELQYVCCDQNEIGVMLEVLPSGADISFNAYCTFAPGGNYNTITGNITYDCAGINAIVSNVRVNFVEGMISSTTFTDDIGSYSYYGGTGTITVTPQLELPDYFIVSPPTETVVFANNGNTSIVNFCLSPNGIKPDLDISIIPITAARPGFDAVYQITYKNKGNQMQSGTISLNFNDDVLDYVSSTQVPSSQTPNLLQWDFNNLLPFQSALITVTLNLNSPVETPPLNSGDILPFSTTIMPSDTDETPNDNTATFTQSVVNSFDPNDKTVIEGATIDISQIGAYLHYVIRFQNVGTAAAQNVVIADYLSSSLDKSTLEIISTSHPFRSTLTSGNKLEFLFEDINLPDSTSDEPGSHGYIAYKIKPAADVTIGTIIENTANIYFDFNLPVVTNTTTTEVTVLATNSFANNEYYKLYPNPADDVLNLENSKGSLIESVMIYNTLGQEVKTIAQNIERRISIPVTDLTTGIYFVRIKSEKGNSTLKFVKN